MASSSRYTMASSSRFSMASGSRFSMASGSRYTGASGSRYTRASGLFPTGLMVSMMLMVAKDVAPFPPAEAELDEDEAPFLPAEAELDVQTVGMPVSTLIVGDLARIDNLARRPQQLPKQRPKIMPALVTWLVFAVWGATQHPVVQHEKQLA